MNKANVKHFPSISVTKMDSSGSGTVSVTNFTQFKLEKHVERPCKAPAFYLKGFRLMRATFSKPLTPFEGPTAVNVEFANYSDQVLPSCHRLWNRLDVLCRAFVSNIFLSQFTIKYD